MVPDTLVVNQLAYQLAFRYGDFNAAAADLRRPPGGRRCVAAVVDQSLAPDSFKAGRLMALLRRGRPSRDPRRRSRSSSSCPMLWLILAPTKSDRDLVDGGPFTFGSFHQVALGLGAPGRLQRPHLRDLDRQLAALRAERDRSSSW